MSMVEASALNNMKIYFYEIACIQDYYHANLLRTEIGKVISIHFDDSKASAIVKVKVKAATGNDGDMQCTLVYYPRPCK